MVVANPEQRGVAVNLVGRSHRDCDEPGQDAFGAVTRLADKAVLLVVSDGAGSCERGHEGSSKLVENALDAFTAVENSTPHGGDGGREDCLKQWWVAVIEEVRTELIADASPGQLEEYSATLVAMIIDGSEGHMAHIGDGAVIGIGADDERVLSSPENGEYAGTTYFFTHDQFSDHLRCKSVAIDDLQGVFVFTDGVEPMAITASGKEAFSGFARPVHNFLQTAEPATGYQALKKTLEASAEKGITLDDMSLIWMSHSCEGDSSEMSQENDEGISPLMWDGGRLFL